MISFQELRERKLVQWAVAYLAGAWGLLQVADFVGGQFGWPALWLRALTVVFAIGFVAVLVVAWYHGEQGRQRVSAIEVGMLAALLVVAGAAVGWVGRTDTAREVGAADEPDTSHVAEQGSIAVLPFVDMSPARDQEYFSDGIAEELLNVLAQLPELRVASRTSAFSFKGSGAAIDSIARVLNVRHVLEGSVRKAGDQVRITAQLIDARTGYHLWSASYDRELSDVFAVQDEISNEIVAQLQLRLSGRAGPLARVETADAEAHNLVLRAAQIFRTGTADALAEAESLLQQAVERDPDYARAHAELARVRELQVYYSFVPRERGLPPARGAAMRALAIDSTDALGHYVLGVIASDYDWDWDQAAERFARAIRHQPGLAPAWQARSWLLMRLGDVAGSLAAARRAVELDPVSPSAYNTAAAMHTYAGQVEAAAGYAGQAIRLGPGNPIYLLNDAMRHSLVGNHDEAVRLARQAAAIAPDLQYSAGALATVLAAAGRTAEAERELVRFRALPDASPYIEAVAQAALGNRERAITLLERAVGERDSNAPDLGVDPALRDYLDDPRVRRLLDEIGLPEVRPTAAPAEVTR